MSKNQLLLEALATLKKMLRDEQALDIAVFRNGRVKSPGTKSGCESLDGCASISTLSLWDTLDQNGKIQVDAAKNLGFKVDLGKGSLESNLSIVASDTQIDQLSDKEKLYIDAIVYTISAELQTPERRIAATKPGPFQEFFDIRSLIREALFGLNLTCFTNNTEVLEKDIDERMSTLSTSPDEQYSAEYDPDDLKFFEKEDLNYQEILAFVNQQELRRKEIRQRNLPKFSQLIEEVTSLARSSDFLEGKIQIDILLTKSRSILELWKSAQPSEKSITTNPFPKETRELENLYHDLVIDAIYQTLQSEKKDGVKRLIQELKSSEASSLAEQTLSHLADHFISLCDGMFSFALGSFLHTNSKTSLKSAYNLASAILPEIENKALRKKLTEAKAEVFLAAVMQTIITTSLSDTGWAIRHSRYEITLDGKPCRIPKRVYDQYEAIQDFMNGNKTASEAASQVMAIGQKDSSNLVRTPGIIVKSYFSLFKDVDGNKTEEEVTEQLTSRNSTSS
ncbi:hypothetical protein [Legionella birminghamensis]|uniref:hypothetical protein n=1 Tax=Legionella birminghamensis TaxID=28083 RepID=UPI0012EE016C|nr:hypothetical protein [Legionella birminghamensis]